MTHLTNRQLDILHRMGVDIWRLRTASTASAEARVAEDHIEETAQEMNEIQSNSASGQPGCAALQALAKTISTCMKCELHQTRTHAVPGSGNPEADWMFIGEAPGQNEDQQGLPFVGRAGKLLDEMIRALVMRREEVFIANVIKCRPPGNRDPLQDEVMHCEPYLHQQLALIRPKIIVALGRVSAQALLKTTEPLGKMRGRVHEYGEQATPLVVTYHPAYLLRSPEQKAKAWQDLLLARSLVNKPS